MQESSRSQQLFITSILNLTSSSISTVCAVLVLFAYLKIKEFKTLSIKLYCFMVISDTMYSVAWFFIPQTIKGNEIENNWSCQASAFLLQFGQLSSVFWSTMISHAIYSAIIKGHIEESSLLKKYMVITYGVSGIISSVPFINGSYGPVEYFCWIQINQHDKIASNQIRMCLFYLPIWALFLIQIFFYFKIDRFEKKIAKGNNLKHKTHRKFIYYSLIFIETWISPTILRTLNMSGVTSQQVFPLACIAIVTSRLQGFMRFLLYVFSKKITKIIKHYMTSNRIASYHTSNHSNPEIQQNPRKSQKAIFKTIPKSNTSPQKQKLSINNEKQEQNNTSINNNQEEMEYDNIKDRDLSFLSIEM
ncbi:hypothetical protein ABPG74_017138 [Tetrahymena malaccensis]